MAYTFRGEKAPEQAKQLAYELRSKYKLPAYTYERTFDFSKPERGIGFNPDGSPKMMRYQQGGVIKEVAVLVGGLRHCRRYRCASRPQKNQKTPAGIHSPRCHGYRHG